MSAALLSIFVLVGTGWCQTAPQANLPDQAAKTTQPEPSPTTDAQKTEAPEKPKEPSGDTQKPEQVADAPKPAPVADPQKAPAADSPKAQKNSLSSMAASLERQRQSVRQQVKGISGKEAPATASFFTVPWVEAPVASAMSASSLTGAASIALCDPMPAVELDKLIEENSKQHEVRADLIRAVIGEESANRPCALSPKGAQGLMQLMPATAEQFGVKDPFDPKQNVEAGTKFLKQLLTKYQGDLSQTLSAYNAGPARVDEQGGVPPITETVNYVNDILAKLASN